ncbi:MAG: DNA translocase FtsK [Candidatus Marinimicrobia bacterium CG08_land_8_20_14_0_20_45_22]|nr:MAG: DNA translocase FtsK [Candidatus Marinimicrobia bacterium CG08_land_8_20_14_0_20_45_22]
MSERRQEITGLLLILLGILVFLSLFSFDPMEEPTISPNVVIQNWMGIVGIFISHYLIKFTIGVASFICPILLVLWGWWLFSGREKRNLIRFSIYVFILSLVVSIALALPAIRQSISSEIGFRYSGLVGGALAKMMYDFLGFYGAIVTLSVVALITMRGYFSWSFYGPFEKFSIWLMNKRQKKARAVVKTPPILPVIPKKPQEPEILKETEPPFAPTEPEEDVDLAFTVDKPITDSKISQAETTVAPPVRKKYHLPTLDLLNPVPDPEYSGQVTKEEMEENAVLVENALETFGVSGKVVHVSPGPIITRYEIEPASGVRVSRIAALSDDLARILQAKRIRIVAPIPGKSVVGVEIPNRHPSVVYIKSIIGSKQFMDSASLLTIALGKTTSGEIYTVDLAKMPHLLIAGATGSGKSVCVNSIIASILYHAKPEEVKFVLIDPKKLELSIYKALEKYHLITCEDLDEFVITRPDNAITALRSVEMEMERRYEVLAEATVRNIDEFNAKVKNGEIEKDLLPYIVIIIDELADLMMTSAKEVEEPITRLAQMSRAVGIHLIIATQRPSVDVITGVIKANFPARIAFQVASKVDSRTILDLNGAEKLLGRGDGLITTPQNPEAFRVHCAFISLHELERILSFIQRQPQPGEMELPSVQEEKIGGDGEYGTGERDALFYQALRLVVNHQQGSISLLQRRLRIGYSRAARLIDELERAGIVGAFTGSKARDVLVDESYLETLNEENSEDSDNP